MIKKQIKITSVFILLIFCSNKCAKEGTCFHFYNKNKEDIIMLAKDEVEDYKNHFLSSDFINTRQVRGLDDSYICFEKHEFNLKKDKKGKYVFYVLPYNILPANRKTKQDSMVINQKQIKSKAIENGIVYKNNSLRFFSLNSK